MSTKINLQNGIFKAVYANDLSAFYPEIWAAEILMWLKARTVASKLVYTNFKNEIQQYGDVVNVQRPNTFLAYRKSSTSDVTVQDASATNIPIKLNQHIHTSFTIKDEERSKSANELLAVYLNPAINAVVQQIEQTVCMQAYDFLIHSSADNTTGKLGTAITKQTLTDTQQKLLDNLAPDGQRFNMLISPATQNTLLNISDLTTADKIADDGQTIRNGLMGTSFNFNYYPTQNMPSLNSTNIETVAGTINYSAGYAAGTTSITFDSTTPTPTVGSWCKIAGDGIPQFITAATQTTATISPGLKNAVSDGAAITFYTPAAINLSGGYAADYVEDIAIDGLSNTPKKLRGVSTGTTVSTRNMYGLTTSASSTEVYFNRALDTAVSNNDVVGLLPNGNYNFAFHRDAIALIFRPLAPAPAGLAASAVASDPDSGLSLRVTMTYNGTSQGTLVTVDLLAGIKTLNTALGVVVLS